VSSTIKEDEIRSTELPAELEFLEKTLCHMMALSKLFPNNKVFDDDFLDYIHKSGRILQEMAETLTAARISNEKE
jgi:hypothetical protein